MDVAVEDYRHYFGQGDRLQMVLNFWLNKYLYLSLAQQRAAPVVKALQAMVTPPDGCCFVNWLRNHDELDLEGLASATSAKLSAPLPLINRCPFTSAAYAEDWRRCWTAIPDA